MEGKHYRLAWLEQSVYIRSAALEHNLLRADSFRVLFLVQQAVFVAGVDTDKDFFYPEEVLSAEWFYASCFSPVYKQHRLSQQFKLIVNCNTLSAEATDHDNDGLPSVSEIANGTDPLNPDSDNDGLLDGVDPDPATPNLLMFSFDIRADYYGSTPAEDILDGSYGGRNDLPWLRQGTSGQFIGYTMQVFFDEVAGGGGWYIYFLRVMIDGVNKTPGGVWWRASLSEQKKAFTGSRQGILNPRAVNITATPV